jgi:hypothetical protein
MGIRDEAEKIIAEQDRRQAAREAERKAEEQARREVHQMHRARALDYVPHGLAQWARGMGMNSVPEYEVLPLDPADPVRVKVLFSEQGLDFEGYFWHRPETPLSEDPGFVICVWLNDRRAGFERVVNSVEDFAAALLEQRRELGTSASAFDPEPGR